RVLRRLVDPLQVFDGQDDRPAPATAKNHLVQRLDSPGLDRLGAERGHALGPLPSSEEVEEERGPLLRLHREHLEPGVDLFEDALRAVSLDDTQHAPKDVDDRKVGDRVAVREAAPLEVRYVVLAQASPKLVQQSGLSDTGLAHDSHDLPASRLRPREETLERIEIVVTSHEETELASDRLESGGTGPEHAVHATTARWRIPRA